MRISRNPILNAELPFLVCSLYTLFETHKTFTLTNIKQDIYSNLNNDNYFSIEMESFKEFYKLLNKLSLRRFSYILIKPILNRDYLLFYNVPKNKMANPKVYNEILFLKKYLRKFKYHYRRYFFFKNGNFVNLPKEKELNVYAIKMLFLIAGI